MPHAYACGVFVDYQKMYIHKLHRCAIQDIASPGGKLSRFCSPVSSNESTKCQGEQKNETDEECGQKCLMIADIGTSDCVYYRNRY